MLEHEANRDAVITIQGGGVYGLTVLGQLQAVIEKHRYTPLALAGTSAGAIVATLLWAGLRPTEIRDEFVKMATQKATALTELLGPFGPPPKPHIDLAGFDKLAEDVGSSIGRLTSPSTRWRWNPLRFVDSLRMAWSLLSLKRRIVPHIQHCGFFRGDALEAKIEELLRRAHDVGPNTTLPGEPLRFRHFAELAAKNKEESYRPPLLFTVTNVKTRQVEVISSVGEKYANVPIAKAVRASAGFPVFFRPKEMLECPEGGWFVDGGLVSNFPVWVFADAFRRKIQASDVFRPLTPKPWIRIGLRVVDDVVAAPDLAVPKVFLRSLFSMLMGRSRNQLEAIISSASARSLVIKQPVSTTQAPQRFLQVDKLTPEKVQAMVTCGFEYADQEITARGSLGIYSRESETDVREELGGLIQRCLCVLGSQEEVKVRANVFIPVEDKMQLIFHYNMDGDGDRTMSFGDLESGLTGFCYMSRRPQVCNLAKVAELRESHPNEYWNLFGMDPEVQGEVRKDRCWLASVPIFDPYELKFTPLLRLDPGASGHVGKSYRGLETELDGALLGVLNIDAGWDYGKMKLHPDPDIHFADDRIQAVLSLMQSASLGLAEILVQVFPPEGEMP